MNANLINCFLKALENILVQFGITDIKKGAVKVKEEMSLNKDIIAFIGIVGEVRGNISYSFSKATAAELASKMMMGMPVQEINEFERSALAELSNMATGNALSLLSSEGISADITPPTVIMGENIFFILGTVRTLTINIETNVGIIEVDFGLES